MEPPLTYWVPSIAISGMAFLTSDRYPGWKGSLFVGSLRARSLVRLELDGDRVLSEERYFTDQLGRIRDVRQGPDGWLYLLTDETDGRIVQGRASERRRLHARRRSTGCSPRRACARWPNGTAAPSVLQAVRELLDELRAQADGGRRRRRAVRRRALRARVRAAPGRPLASPRCARCSTSPARCCTPTSAARVLAAGGDRGGRRGDAAAEQPRIRPRRRRRAATATTTSKACCAS